MLEIPVEDPSRRLRDLQLDTSGCFKTYSDAKLASLVLENDLPILLVQKVFETIQDPKFRLNEVTLRNVWEVYDCVSEHRRSDATKRATPAPPIRSRRHRASKAQIKDSWVVLDAVVDKLLEERVPLGVAAMERSWKSAFKSQAADFHNLSLVHRSWTAAAQRGLRHRVVIPYKQINEFLLSPLCGPWVVEMIIYWTVDCRRESVTSDDFARLKALFERTPNIHSLSFNTSLVSFSDQQGEPFLGAGACLEIIATMLPNLRNLWLKHCYPPGGYNLYQGCYLTGVCNELDSLCRHIQRMKSLEFLSVRSWTGKRQQDDSLRWDKHPPSRLKTIDLDLSGELFSQHITWLAKSRGRFRPDTLSIVVREAACRAQSLPALQECLRKCLLELKNLRLCILNDWMFGFNPMKHRIFCNNILSSCSKLEILDFFVLYEQGFELDAIQFPRSLRRLAIHCYDDANARLPLPTSSRSSSPSFLRRFNATLAAHLAKLPELKSLLITGSPRQQTKKVAEDWDLDGFTRHMNPHPEVVQETAIPDIPLQVCKKAGITLTCLNNAFPRDWDVPREG